MLLRKNKKGKGLIQNVNREKSNFQWYNLILKSMSIVNKNKFDDKKTCFRFSERFCFN